VTGSWQTSANDQVLVTLPASLKISFRNVLFEFESIALPVPKLH
jgi:hypothetical protein